jgi:hypothetical protein
MAGDSRNNTMTYPTAPDSRRTANDPSLSGLKTLPNTFKANCRTFGTLT